MKNNRQIILEWLESKENVDLVSKIANSIFEKYPTLQSFKNSCEKAFIKTGDKKFQKLPLIIKNNMQWFCIMTPEIKNEPVEVIYYNALLKLVRDHKSFRTNMLAVAGMFGGAAITGSVGYAVAGPGGAAFGALPGMFGGIIGSGLYGDRIAHKSRQNIYDTYKKDHDVNNMLSRL